MVLRTVFIWSLVSGGLLHLTPLIAQEIPPRLERSLDATADSLMRRFRSEGGLWRGETRTSRKTTAAAHATLLADKQTILAVAPEVTKFYRERHFTDDEICRATTTAWADLRIGANPTTERLTGRCFVDFAKGWCYLVVKSTPPDALVHVGKQDWGTTTAEGFLRVGRYSIHVRKDGYEPIDHEMELSTDRKNALDVVLNKTPSSTPATDPHKKESTRTLRTLDVAK